MLLSEKNRWKTDWEVLDKRAREVSTKYDEAVELAKLNEKKLAELRVDSEKYRTIAVSLEEELHRIKTLPPADPEIQIIEKIIEKP